MVFIIKDIKLGLLAMLPNILPITLTFAFMVLMDWPFDLTSAMVGGIAMGIVVDDTLHFMSQFKNYSQQQPHRPVAWALQQTFHTTGRALIITTILLCTVFAGDLVPDLQSMKIFSFLLLMVTALALICDFIVAPSLIVWFFQPR